MYRTADEAWYDCVRPIIPYEAPIAWGKIEKEGRFERIQAKELCAGCLEPIVPFKDSFTMNAGYGGVYLVSESSGFCRACFDALRANPPKYRPVPRVKINYACGSESLQTIEDME